MLKQDLENKRAILKAIQKDCEEKLNDQRLFDLDPLENNELLWAIYRDIEVALETLTYNITQRSL